jgi:thrombospondin motif-containing protein 9
VADESACATLPKPVAKEECSVTPCGQWKALDWSSVSVGFVGLGGIGRWVQG